MRERAGWRPSVVPAAGRPRAARRRVLPLVVAAARPVPGNTADAKDWRDSGSARHCEGVTVLGGGAYLNTGLVVPHRKRPGRALLPGEEEDGAEHRKVRARSKIRLKTDPGARTTHGPGRAGPGPFRVRPVPGGARPVWGNRFGRGTLPSNGEGSR